MRKILRNIALPLVRRHCLYGEYYYRKKEIEKMPGNKAMTTVARHFLEKFFGWYKSAQAFDPQDSSPVKLSIKRLLNCIHRDKYMLFGEPRPEMTALKL